MGTRACRKRGCPLVAVWMAAAAASCLSVRVAAEETCPIRLRDVSRSTGVQFEHTHGGCGRQYIFEAMSAGLALFDYDRDGDEVTACAGTRVAPPGALACNPVFDVTPAELIDVLVTERGAGERPCRASVAALFPDWQHS